MTTLKLIAVGDGRGVVLPPEVLEQLGGANAKEVELHHASGGVLIRACNDEAARQLEAAKSVMQEDSETLNRLAQ